VNFRIVIGEEESAVLVEKLEEVENEKMLLKNQIGML